jgi:hypothetical protein
VVTQIIRITSGPKLEKNVFLKKILYELVRFQNAKEISPYPSAAKLMESGWLFFLKKVRW